MNKYDDMSVFLVLLDEGNIADAVDSLCRKMDFIFCEKNEKYAIYKSITDSRSFLLTVEGTTEEHFFMLYIKCKAVLKYRFFYCIEKQLQEMEDWGMQKKNADEYPDLLTLGTDNSNPYVRNLSELGLSK
ncbi:MAG: hypothetical protein IJ446_06960 [Oscillospiraceae bacterium]|nr:hypothetical protein [Oscillospiraceae bacterium]